MSLCTNRLLAVVMAGILPAASCLKHHLYVGNLYGPSRLHALEFDDETLTFVKTNEITADAPHAWITFNHDKTAVYGTSLSTSRIASYSVQPPDKLELTNAIPASGVRCVNTTSAFAVASPLAPYHVYTGSWPGSCGMALAVQLDRNGTLEAVAGSWQYANGSAIHGLALGGRDKQVLYAADLRGDAIWTHRLGRDGKARRLGRFGVKAGSHPRHLASHPQGRRLYAVMEAQNSVVEFAVDAGVAGLPGTGVVTEMVGDWSLIPEGFNSSKYWSAEVMLSSDNRYLWATARALQNTTYPGYVNAFLLDDHGAIVKRLFMMPTTTVGGIANAISPAPWASEWSALTDIGTGYVQIWKMSEEKAGDHGIEYGTAVAVARVDINDGGCCANAIWLD